MIQTIIDLFYNLTRQHKDMRSFIYDRTYNIGSGNDKYPLLWLEDPLDLIYEKQYYTANIDFAILYSGKDKYDPAIFQNAAFAVGASMIEKIRQDYKESITITDWNVTTLRGYYDDGANGCRFSLTMQIRNNIDLCNLKNDYDKEKELLKSNYLPQINIDKPSQNCVPLGNKPI